MIVGRTDETWEKLRVRIQQFTRAEVISAARGNPDQLIPSQSVYAVAIRANPGSVIASQDAILQSHNVPNVVDTAAIGFTGGPADGGVGQGQYAFVVDATPQTPEPLL